MIFSRLCDFDLKYYMVSWFICTHIAIPIIICFKYNYHTSPSLSARTSRFIVCFNMRDISPSWKANKKNYSFFNNKLMTLCRKQKCIFNTWLSREWKVVQTRVINIELTETAFASSGWIGGKNFPFLVYEFFVLLASTARYGIDILVIREKVYGMKNIAWKIENYINAE